MLRDQKPKAINFKFVNAIMGTPFNQSQLKFEFFYHYNNFWTFFGKAGNKKKIILKSSQKKTAV